MLNFLQLVLGALSKYGTGLSRPGGAGDEPGEAGDEWMPRLTAGRFTGQQGRCLRRAGRVVSARRHARP